jgi:hypothetical protein
LYFNTFKKVYKNYTKNDIDEVFQNELLNLLNNKPYNNKLVKDNLIFLKKELIPFIKTLNKNEIQVVYSIITRIKGLSSIVKAIYPYLLEKQMNYQQSRDNITLKDIDKLKYEKISFVKNDVLKILDSDELSLSPYEKLVYALFTLFPVRRPVDYIRMEIISSIPKKEEKKQINERKNYYNNGIFYFNRTKNKEIQSFKIPDELNKIIIDYIKQRDDGALLLNERNKELLIGTFKTHILKVFNKIYGISYSAVELRHYYSTYINNLVKMKQMTIEEHRKICIMMNHSYEENKKYAYLLD